MVGKEMRRGGLGLRKGLLVDVGGAGGWGDGEGGGGRGEGGGGWMEGGKE